MGKRGVFKNDALARETWGGAFYEAVPKSTFALIAWHLANQVSGTADEKGAAEQAFLTEWTHLAEVFKADGLQGPSKSLRTYLEG